MKLSIIREEGEFLGTKLLGFACTCGYSTDNMVATREAELRAHMEKHWADEHPDELDELGKGACAVCGVVTDHLKIKSEIGPRRVYLCRNHAPADRLRTIFEGQQP